MNWFKTTKKNKRRGRLTLLSKIMLLNTFLVAAMLIFSIGLSARFSIQLLDEKMTDNLHTVAQMLGTDMKIIAALKKGKTSERLDKYLDAAIKADNNVDVITVADMNSIRLYHKDKDRVGQRFIGGDEERVLKGEHYNSRAWGTLGYQNRYFYPVKDETGSQIGFVLVSMLMDHLDTLRREVIITHLKAMVVVFVVGVAASIVLSMSIKRSLLGFEPDQIRQGFLLRKEIMDSLEEGLVAVDRNGSVVMVNQAAGDMLEKKEGSMRGQSVNEILPGLNLKDILQQDGIICNHNLVLEKEDLLCDSIPIRKGKKTIGAVAILRDRSEVTRMAEQLTGANHLVEALRANTHEFMNQLHVILGLLQTDGVEEAKQFILEVGSFQNETISSIAKSIDNRTLAALILGKMNRCRELGIRLSVFDRSRIPAHSAFLSTPALITVTGNLIENAIDAIQAKGELDKAGEINLVILENRQSLHIAVDDTGIGMTPEEKALTENPGYSTKGKGRGTGMSLIRGVAEMAEGEISIESEKGVGTSILITFYRKRQTAPLDAKEDTA